jgi:hypothetical protein
MPLQAEGNRPGWQVKARTVWRFVQWAIFDAVLTILALPSLHWIVSHTFMRGQGGATTSRVAIEAVFLWVGVAVVVLIPAGRVKTAEDRVNELACASLRNRLRRR